MLEKMCDTLIDYLCRCKIVQNEQEIYKYGLMLMISEGISTVVIVLISLFLKRISFALLYLLMFAILRRYTGGYHAPTRIKCFISFVCLYLFSLYLFDSSTHFAFLFYDYIAMIVILFMAPINNHKVLSNTMVTNNKRKAIFSLFVTILFRYMLLILNNKYAGYISVVLFLIALLILIEYIPAKKEVL